MTAQLNNVRVAPRRFKVAVEKLVSLREDLTGEQEKVSVAPRRFRAATEKLVELQQRAEAATRNAPLLQRAAAATFASSFLSLAYLLTE